MKKVYEIKTALLKDASMVADLAAFTFREAWLEPGNEQDLERYVEENFNLDVIKKELSNADITYLLVFAEDELAGYVKLQRNDQPEGYELKKTVALHRLYIKAKFRNMKLGGALVEHSISLAEKEGFQSIWLGVWNENHHAIRFYNRFGFERFGNYQFIMGSIVSDDYLLKKELM